MRNLRIVAGLFIAAMGLLWMGQGAGYILWPESSFMLRETEWIYYGGATALLGTLIVAFGLRKRG